MQSPYSPYVNWRFVTVGCLCALLVAGIDCQAQTATTTPSGADSLPAVLTRAEAVRWALLHNPELTAFRQQHGIAAAGVVIAETYPFNPAWEARVQGNSGPTSAGISNRVSQEHRIAMEVELRHQGQSRRDGARAALSRTDWEIAFLEQLLAVRTVRAFNTAVYRQKKLDLLEETLTLAQQTAKLVTQLRPNKFSAADEILAESDVQDARAALGSARTMLSVAQYDLRRLLGVLDQRFVVQGSLELSPIEWSTEALLQGALEQRADLHARQAGVAEAQARLELEIRNRWGNPNIGPIYTLDPTNVSSIGASLTLPLPVVNTRRGEIQQREAERARAGLDLRQSEITVQQDIAAALRRLREARAWQQTYEKEVLPHLQGDLKQMQSLLENAFVDVLRMSAVRRNLIRARDGYLDALFEVNQAQADLAAAVGDPALALNPGTIHK